MFNPELFNIAKAIHMIAISLTIAGFLLRGAWMLRDSPLLHSKPARILPHINDTVLLLSALWTAAILGQYPFVNMWLTAKVLGTLAYIVVGAVALTYGPTKKIRVRAFIAAILCFGYVVAVAATKNPLLF
jgi:uncharacterized membrane protein SirB2